MENLSRESIEELLASRPDRISDTETNFTFTLTLEPNSRTAFTQTEKRVVVLRYCI